MTAGCIANSDKEARDVVLSSSGTTTAHHQAQRSTSYTPVALTLFGTDISLQFKLCILPPSLCILHTHPISALNHSHTTKHKHIPYPGFPSYLCISLERSNTPDPCPAPHPRASYSCFSSPTRGISHDTAAAGFVHCALFGVASSKEGDKRKEEDHTDRRGRDLVHQSETRRGGSHHHIHIT